MANQDTNSKKFLKYSSIDRALYQAVIEKRDLAKTRIALANGANANLPLQIQYGCTMIQEASEQINAHTTILHGIVRDSYRGDRLTNLKIIRLLLAHGANPNQYDSSGRTVLMMAVESRCKYAPKIVKLLLQAGANVNAVCQCNVDDGKACGNTVLSTVTGKSSDFRPNLKLEIIDLLLAHNVDITAGNGIINDLTCLKYPESNATEYIETEYLIIGKLLAAGYKPTEYETKQPELALALAYLKDKQ